MERNEVKRSFSKLKLILNKIFLQANQEAGEVKAERMLNIYRMFQASSYSDLTIWVSDSESGASAMKFVEIANPLVGWI